VLCDPDAGRYQCCRARGVARVRDVRQDKSSFGARTGYLTIETLTESGPLALRIAASDAADLAALLGLHAQARD
jgi:hypothetical protein